MNRNYTYYGGSVLLFYFFLGQRKHLTLCSLLSGPRFSAVMHLMTYLTKLETYANFSPTFSQMFSVTGLTLEIGGNFLIIIVVVPSASFSTIKHPLLAVPSCPGFLLNEGTLSSNLNYFKGVGFCN